jgi:SpoVK/Ycf46/Vps4 family AAA+-type ATPase
LSGAGLEYSEQHAHARRGILFYGEPGTGKTLAARALAGACAAASPQPVAFFARKGADCLGKFAGEAERTLRLLFDEVRRAKIGPIQNRHP